MVRITILYLVPTWLFISSGVDFINASYDCYVSIFLYAYSLMIYPLFAIETGLHCYNSFTTMLLIITSLDYV